MARQETTNRRTKPKSVEPLLPAGKVPPNAVDLEEAVLGAMMLEKNAYTSVLEILKGEAFYKPQHQMIFAACKELFDRGEPIDILTVTAELRKNGDLEAVGGAYYITSLTNRVSSAANVEYHARIIAEKHIQRQLVRIGSEIATEAFEEGADALDLLDGAQQKIFEVSEGSISRDVEKIDDLLKKTIKHLESIKNHESKLTGIPSGFVELDRETSGWQRSDLIIVAARPGMGKCLGKGTKVLMYDGTLKNVEDVATGELLMGDDSTPRKVLSIARGRENMYWVHQNHGISYRVNESHILSLKRSRNEGPHKNGDVLNIPIAEYITKSDKFKSNYKGYKVAVEFEEKPTSLDPYYIGLWLGDGHSYSSRITNTDTEVIDYLRGKAEEMELELVEYTQEGKTSNYSITKGQRGGVQAYSIQGELRAMGLLDNKHIPQNYLTNSSEKRLELLAGLIDADGHYNAEFHVYEITQKNEELAKQIKFLCDTLGFKTSFTAKKASISGRELEGEVYRVRISGNIEIIPAKIERKKARNRVSAIDWRHTGITVEYDKLDDYYGFVIDGNHLFLLEDMTVTHNTAFALTVARNAAVDFAKSIAIFSLEMSGEQLVSRLISGETEIGSQKMRNGDLSAQEWERLNNKIGKLGEAKIFIDDTPGISVFELKAKCRRLKAQQNIDMIVIDYLQLMRGEENKGVGNREQEIGYISRSLKGLAKELHIPVIALAQLSRAVEVRGGNKKPMLSDLRESGSIEQDADMVMFLYRPEYYKITEFEDGMPTQGLAEIMLAKHRHGAVGDYRVRFKSDFAKFADMEQGYMMDNSGGGGNFSFSEDPGVGGGTRSYTLPSKMNDMDEDVPF